MQNVTAKDLKNHTGEILRRVRGGATVSVTNRGRRVAIISPVSPVATEKEAGRNADSEAWAQIQAALAATTPEHADWREALRRARRRP